MSEVFYPYRAKDLESFVGKVVDIYWRDSKKPKRVRLVSVWDDERRGAGMFYMPVVQKQQDGGCYIVVDMGGEASLINIAQVCLVE